MLAFGLRCVNLVMFLKLRVSQCVCGSLPWGLLFQEPSSVCKALPWQMVSLTLGKKKCVQISSICWLKMYCESKGNFLLVNSFIKLDFLRRQSWANSRKILCPLTESPEGGGFRWEGNWTFSSGQSGDGLCHRSLGLILMTWQVTPRPKP